MISGLIVNRVKSIVHYEASYEKITSFVNKLISVVPDEVIIPDYSQFLVGGVKSGFTIYESDYMFVPLDIFI